MKRSFLPQLLAAAVSLLPLSAEVPLSEKLTKIAGHLGEGGAHFSVTDSEDDLKNLAVFLDRILGAVPETDLPTGFEVETLFEDLGLYGLQGKGASAHQLDELWHNRSFFLTDGSRKGLLSLPGKKAAPSVAHEFAPPGADLVLETSLDLREVEKMARKIAGDLDPESAGEVEETFTQKLGAGGMTLASLLADFSVRGTLVFWLDEEKTFATGPESAYPVPHLAARLDQATIVWTLLISELAEMGELVEDGDEVKFIPDNSEIESPFGLLKPHFVWNPEKQQLFFGLTEADLAACRGEGARISTDRDFKRATEGFPEMTSGLAYLSRDFLETAVAVAKEYSRALPPEAGEIAESLTPYAETLSRKGGYAGAFSVEEDGFLLVANLPEPMKGGGVIAGLGGISTVATIAGMTTPMILKAKKAGDEVQKLSALKMYAGAQGVHRHEYGKYAPTIDLLLEREIIDPGVAEELKEADVKIILEGTTGNVPSTTVIGTIPSDRNPGSFLVARADGSASEMTGEALTAQLEKQRKK